MEGLEIVRLSDDRIPHVQALAKNALKRKIPMDYLRHKYRTKGYAGHEYVCTLGYFQGKPVGFYGAVPLIFTDGNDSFLGIQICDSYTHSDFQRQGIYGKLATASYELMKEAGARFGISFHSEVTENANKKFGWTSPFNMSRFHLQTGAKFNRLRVLSKFDFLSDRRKNLISSALSKYTQSVVFPTYEDDRLRVRYDEQYCAYKNQVGNNRIIEVEGCSLWLRFFYVLQVGAIHGLTQENVGVVLEALKTIGRKVGSPEVVIHSSERAEDFEILKQRLAPKPSFPMGFRAFEENVDFSRYVPNVIELDSFL